MSCWGRGGRSWSRLPITAVGYCRENEWSGCLGSRASSDVIQRPYRKRVYAIRQARERNRPRRSRCDNIARRSRYLVGCNRAPAMIRRRCKRDDGRMVSGYGRHLRWRRRNGLRHGVDFIRFGAVAAGIRRFDLKIVGRSIGQACCVIAVYRSADSGYRIVIIS
ncbi:hypothetical protein D3C74_354720 [compost metagenome]